MIPSRCLGASLLPLTLLLLLQPSHQQQQGTWRPGYNSTYALETLGIYVKEGRTDYNAGTEGNNLFVKVMTGQRIPDNRRLRMQELFRTATINSTSNREWKHQWNYERDSRAAFDPSQDPSVLGTDAVIDFEVWDAKSGGEQFLLGTCSVNIADLPATDTRTCRLEPHSQGTTFLDFTITHSVDRSRRIRLNLRERLALDLANSQRNRGGRRGGGGRRRRPLEPVPTLVPYRSLGMQIGWEDDNEEPHNMGFDDDRILEWFYFDSRK